MTAGGHARASPAPIRAALALSVTLAIHLLLVLAWTQSSRDKRDQARDDTREVVSVLLLPPARVPVALPRAQQRPAPVAVAPPQAQQRPSAALARPATRADTAAAPSAPPSPAPAAFDNEQPPPRASAADIMAQAKRDIGTIDRALRGSALAVPRERPDSPQARFEATVAAAFIDRSVTMTMDRYTSPDGVVIIRITQLGHTSCYRSGTVNFVPGILRNSERPNQVRCPPPNAGWARQ